jgi:hypothetical protein
MQCPKCGFLQPDRVIECGKCGVIIAKAMKAQQSPAEGRPAPASSTLSEASDEKNPLSLTAIVLLLVVANAALWWINFPPANGIPDGAYVNMKHRFALSAPRDWLQLTPENAERIFEENKDRFTDSFRNSFSDSITNPGVEVGFVKVPDGPNDFTPSLNVVVIPLQMPPLSESEKEKAAGGMVREMKKGLAGYTRESASIIEVDGLTSLEIIGRVPLTVVSQKAGPIIRTGAYGMRQAAGYTQEVRKTFTIKLRQLFVPGKKRSYMITYTGEADNLSDVAPVFNSVTKSFRVLQRPPRFGRIMRSTLNGGLFSLSAYLTFLLIRRLSGRLSRN